MLNSPVILGIFTDCRLVPQDALALLISLCEESLDLGITLCNWGNGVVRFGIEDFKEILLLIVFSDLESVSNLLPLVSCDTRNSEGMRAIVGVLIVFIGSR